MTSISEPNSGKSAYLFRHALNSPNACCSSSAFSDSVMISSPPIVIALLIFPTLLCFFYSWFSIRLLFGANFLTGLLHASCLCPARRPRFRRFHMHRGLGYLPDFHAWNGFNSLCARYETIAQPAHNSCVVHVHRFGERELHNCLAQLTVIKTSSTDAPNDAINCISQLSPDKRSVFGNYPEITSHLLCTRLPCNLSHASHTSASTSAPANQRSRRRVLRACCRVPDAIYPHIAGAFRARRSASSGKACPAAHRQILRRCSGLWRE